MTQTAGEHVGTEGIGDACNPSGKHISRYVSRQEEHREASHRERAQYKQVIRSPSRHKGLQWNRYKRLQKYKCVKGKRDAIGGKDVFAKQRRMPLQQRLLHPPQIPDVYGNVAFEPPGHVRI